MHVHANRIVLILLVCTWMVLGWYVIVVQQLLLLAQLGSTCIVCNIACCYIFTHLRL
jgi:hypothetical protein